MFLSAQFHQLSLGADVGIPFGDMADDGATLILGPTLGYETPTFGASRVSLTLQAGYSLVFVKEAENSNRPAARSWNMIPAHLGLKYYFTDPQLGWYVHGQGGIHSMIRDFGEVTHTVTVTTTHDDGTVTTSDETTRLPTLGITSTLFSYALGVGFQTERLDVSLRYQGIGADEERTVFVQLPTGNQQEAISYPTAAAYSYIGIRIAYLFNLGGTARTTTP
jgi:hypothetical protein